MKKVFHAVNWCQQMPVSHLILFCAIKWRDQALEILFAICQFYMKRHSVLNRFDIIGYEIILQRDSQK